MNDRFLRACRGEPTDCVPVWFMRQAGRSLPEYRKLRDRHSLLDICRRAELAAEATLQPIRRLGVDAAILFSDIVVPLQAMGVELDIRPGVGPVVAEPIRDLSGVTRLRSLEPEEDVAFVLDAVALLAGELDVPLIGFAGAPFTLASYLVEGGPSRQHLRTKSLMYSEPRAWEELMDRLAGAMVAYLRAQAKAGAHAVQLFDSWAGCLAPDDYRRYVMPAVEHIFGNLADLGIPRIYFGVATGHLLPLIATTGADVIGVDWRTPLDEARRRSQDDLTLQGNLDPTACLAPPELLETKVLDVLRRGGGRRHIFNLGHGVLPETDPGALAHIVQLVHAWRPTSG